MPAASVFIVWDVPFLREALAEALERREEIRVLGMAGEEDGAVAQIAALLPDIVLLDGCQPDGPSWLPRIREHAPEVAVVALALPDDEEAIVAWAEAGVVGYVPDDASLGSLVSTIEAVARGETLCPPQITAALFRRVAAHAASGHRPEAGRSLTLREREILQLLSRGLRDKEIGVALSISLPTVKSHVRSVLMKLGARNRAEAIASVRELPPNRRPAADDDGSED